MSRQDKYRWVVLSLYMLVSIFSFIGWLTFASIETVVETRFHQPNQAVVWLSQVYVLSVLVLAIPAGKLIDKFGFKKGVGIGVAFIGAFSLFRLINIHSFSLLLMAQSGLAIGQPFLINGINKFVMEWFPGQQRATATGLVTASFVIGEMIALGLTPFLVESVGFEPMLYAYSSSAAFCSFLFLLLIKSGTHKHAIEKQSLMSELKLLLKIKNFNLAAAIFVVIVATGVYLLTNFEVMVTELYGLPLSTIGLLSLIFMSFGIVGRILVPIVSDKIRNRKILLVISLVIFATSLLLIPFCKGFTSIAIVTSIIGLSLSATQPLLFTMCAEMVETKYAGIQMGSLQFLANGGSLIAVPLLAFVRSASGNFIVPILSLLIIVAASIFMSLKMKDTYLS